MSNCNLRMRRCFKYRDLKMFLSKLESELENLNKNFQSVLKIQRKYRLNTQEVECTTSLMENPNTHTQQLF